MKGAIILLIILLLGFLTAQSFDVLGYDINYKDKIFLQNIYSKIDKNDIDTTTIEAFLPYLDYFPTNSRSYILLHEIYDYVRGVNAPHDIQNPTNTYPEAFINLLGQQFAGQ